MHESLQIISGRNTALTGEVQISGAKNAALPMLIASLLTSEPVEFENIPRLEDTALTLSLLEHFGADIWYHQDKVRVRTPKLISSEACYSLVKALRASFWVLGPILARSGRAQVALPGGDLIGARPVDLHIAALEKMGAQISLKHGTVYATAPNGLFPANIDLSFPSVGATHQIMMTAALVDGETIIKGAAKEPEIIAVAELLNMMGAKVEGAGGSVISIQGKKHLGGARARVIGDRIEAGTYLLAACATGGEVTTQGIDPDYLTSVVNVLREMGASIDCGDDFIHLKAPAIGKLNAIDVTTGPFPEFPTDLQAPLMAALTQSNGVSNLRETIFEGRFRHAGELCRMGAEIQIEGEVAIITGLHSSKDSSEPARQLSAAEVECFDIRAGAALVIAALAANGTSTITSTEHIRRGYEELEGKLTKLGANVRTCVTDAEDYVFAGC